MDGQLMTWQYLAKADAQATRLFFEGTGITPHRIDIPGPERRIHEDRLAQYLLDEYMRSHNFFDYKRVDYLPYIDCTPLGVFSKTKLLKNTHLASLTGVLCEIEEDEIDEDFNGFSIIHSSRVGAQWIMLGPISFINNSCKPNVKYVIDGDKMKCVTIKEIEEGEELSIEYHKHFFGDFNVDCLCPFKSKHGNPFPELSLPKKRVRKQKTKRTLTDTPLSEISDFTQWPRQWPKRKKRK